MMERGCFTLPGEAGHEKLTLELARRWGADVLRDSDGTWLSQELLHAGYGVYSTLCPIREHNGWIREHPNTRQQTFLSTPLLVAEGTELRVAPLEGFFSRQFQVNDSPEAMAYWQVYDRTENRELPQERWRWNPSAGTVDIQATPWRQYTVSFLAWRIWEEISMYNHVTNGWDKEPLMQLNPYRPEARAYLKTWMADWCRARPDTTVVRFTSLFYNFAWIWGAHPENRHLFTDWGSYDFTVSPEALEDFARQHGYALTAEDFVRQGKHNATHRVPGPRQRDWMAFIGGFVRELGRELVQIVHSFGKRAYVFYDDSWVGLEPYNGRFEEFAFDGIIKCVFSGYEVRLCAGVPAPVHEIRLHPYLFPVGLGGAPTFAPGGRPGKDALEYWVGVRRALLRQKVERAGLGGYLHLVREYPDFMEAMDRIVREFREIRGLHEGSAPRCEKPVVGVLTAWGSLRTWTLSGHFHETCGHVLIHVLESLAGLPFEVRFLSFEDVREGVPGEIDVLVNAGEGGGAWSGGSLWQDVRVVDALTAWVHRGGVLLGIGEPGASRGNATCLRMAHVLGVDLDGGERDCHGRWTFEAKDEAGLIPGGIVLAGRRNVILTDGTAQVLAAVTLEGERYPAVTLHPFGKGKGVYLSGFRYDMAHSRLLQNLLLHACGLEEAGPVTQNLHTECALYPALGKLALVNNSAAHQDTACLWQGRRYAASLAPYEMRVLDLEQGIEEPD